MAISGITKLINDLTEQTTIQDTDYMIIGGADAKKIKWTNIITKIKNTIMSDSGWKTATLTSNFALYGSGGSPVRYRKIGNKVMIEGVVSPTKTLTSSATSIAMFTLPDGYRPTKAKYLVCPGSIKNSWLLTVSPTDGTVSVARYGTSGFTDMTTSAWLPFNFEFVID